MRIDINKYNRHYFSILITQTLLGSFMKEKNMAVYLIRASHLNNNLTSFIATAVVIVQQQYQQTTESSGHKRRG